MISSLTAILKKILFLDFFVHLAYCLFSFWGLTILIKELKWSLYKEYILVFFLSMPSFGMWTSVISKEAFTCFFTCIALVWLVNLFEKKPLRFSVFLNLISLYIIIIMRPTVGVGLLLLIIILYYFKITFINKYVRFLSIILTVFISSIIVYNLANKYIKDEFLPLAEAYFDPSSFSSTSTRKFGFWKSASDLFLKAPQGIFIANLGPTLPESINKPYFMPYFLEGMLFIITMIYLISAIIFKQLFRDTINPNFVMFLLFGVILILFMNYPFGLFNPGSATRYRSSYYHIIIVGLLYFYYKEKSYFKMKNLIKD
ncbi:MAG: hypothetical protein KKE39_00415 [Bacteroidetes bacterium]|nr:hypothetical protein [Bacteroidota bacterium]